MTFSILIIIFAVLIYSNNYDPFISFSRYLEGEQ